jgi:DUF438 domain-containing protein
MSSRYNNKPAKELTSLLKRIYLGEDPQILRREVTHFINRIDPSDIVAAEQNLIDDGYSTQVARELSATFMLLGIPQDQSDNPRLWLPTNHLLRMVFAEHDLFRCFLAELAETTESIEHIDNLKTSCLEFRKLTHTAEHLNAMIEHIDREDYVIFPTLQQIGPMGSCLAVQSDHVRIRSEIENLFKLVISFDRLTEDEFRHELREITKALSRTALEHLFQEDEIVYPIALAIVKDQRVWQRIKCVCDEIGYCGVHL